MLDERRVDAVPDGRGVLALADWRDHGHGRGAALVALANRANTAMTRKVLPLTAVGCWVRVLLSGGHRVAVGRRTAAGPIAAPGAAHDIHCGVPDKSLSAAAGQILLATAPSH